MAPIAASPMLKAGETNVGVVGGSSPLKVVVPVFTTKMASQSMPLATFDNTVALHPAPYTLHPTPYTLHPSLYTLHSTPYTLSTKHDTRNTKP